MQSIEAIKDEFEEGSVIKLIATRSCGCEYVEELFSDFDSFEIYVYHHVPDTSDMRVEIEESDTRAVATAGP